jgi:hypothetical protein
MVMLLAPLVAKMVALAIIGAIIYKLYRMAIGSMVKTIRRHEAIIMGVKRKDGAGTFNDLIKYAIELGQIVDKFCLLTKNQHGMSSMSTAMTLRMEQMSYLRNIEERLRWAKEAHIDADMVKGTSLKEDNLGIVRELKTRIGNIENLIEAEINRQASAVPQSLVLDDTTPNMIQELVERAAATKSLMSGVNDDIMAATKSGGFVMSASTSMSQPETQTVADAIAMVGEANAESIQKHIQELRKQRG